MIICNGVVGLCLLVGAVRHHTLAFRAEGASHALAALAPLVTLTLVLPLFHHDDRRSHVLPLAELHLCRRRVALPVCGVRVRSRPFAIATTSCRCSAEAEDEHAPPPADQGRHDQHDLAGGVSRGEVVETGEAACTGHREPHSRRARRPPPPWCVVVAHHRPPAGIGRCPAGRERGTACRRASTWRWAPRSPPSDSRFPAWRHSPYCSDSRLELGLAPAQIDASLP